MLWKSSVEPITERCPPLGQNVCLSLLHLLYLLLGLELSGTVTLILCKLKIENGDKSQNEEYLWKEWLIRQLKLGTNIGP